MKPFFLLKISIFEKDIPKPVPIKSKITQEMFGDAVMILEFLDNFGDLFSLKDDFPNGFSYGRQTLFLKLFLKINL
jgi:hypothetical protein